jgi:deferrochelatase/peroxidase EfeB
MARKKAAPMKKADAAQHSRESYPCYGTHQQGITTPHQPFAIMAAF